MAKSLAEQYPPADKLAPKVKAKFLEALRSGEYEQGRGQLCTVDPETGKKSYCCLGVANKVFKLGKADSCGFVDGLLLSEDIQSKLVAANDGGFAVDTSDFRTRKNGTASFKSIANWIEKNL